MCILNSPKTALKRGFRKRVNNLWIVNSIKERGCIKALSRSEWVDTRDLERVMILLQPTNELVCRLCLETGLRISDALSLTVEQVRKKKFSILEQKTGKRKCINLLTWLRDELLMQAGRLYVFPHRSDGTRTRTRNAVWKDLKRVDNLLKVWRNVTPHSMRKAYAVEKFNKSGDLEKVRRLLNHSSDAVTMLYALADKYSARVKKLPKWA